jgi:hypothetical protein
MQIVHYLAGGRDRKKLELLIQNCQMNCTNLFHTNLEVSPQAICDGSTLIGFKCQVVAGGCQPDTSCTGISGDNLLVLSTTSCPNVAATENLLGTSLSANVTSIQIASYAEGSCSASPVALENYRLQTCLPFVDHPQTYIQYYTDFAANVYFQTYFDVVCSNTTASSTKVNAPLQNSPAFTNSNCTPNNQTAKIVNPLGYQVSYYHGVQGNVTAWQCNQDNTTVSIQLDVAAPWVSVPNCTETDIHQPITDYDIVQDAKTKYGSKPYAMFDVFAAPNCGVNSTVARRAVLLNSCLTINRFPFNEAYQMYTLASNGSLVVKYFNDNSCFQALPGEVWDNANCTSYANVGNIRIFNAPASSVASSVSVSAGLAVVLLVSVLLM